MNSRLILHVLTLGLFAMVAAPLPLIAAAADRGASWREFHGPNRDNISPERGLLKQWPEGGPRLIWKYSECGRGHACVSIADGLIFTTGDFADKEMVIALDLDGKPAWKAENGKSWRGDMPGSRTTPTCIDGVLYDLNPTGRLAAYQAKSGKEIWAVDLREEYGAKYGTWAMAENVAIDGDAVLCVPGGSRGRIVALDKRTGARIWTNTEVADCAAYCSPIVVTHGGVRQMITLMQKSVVSVDVRTGKLLWSHAHQTKHDQNVTMPIFRDGCVYVSSGHGTGGKLLKISDRSDGVTEVWAGTDLDNCHGGVILVGGCLYGSGCRLNGAKGLICVDFLTGKTLWSDKAIGKVSITHADGLFYGQTEGGRMMLLEAGPKACRVVSRFDVRKPSGGPCYAHPVVCGGTLYVRHGTELFAYDITAAPR